MDALHRILEVTRKEALELWRNAGVVIFILAIPVVEMTVLGFATAGEVANLPTAVFDSDGTAASRQLINTVHQSRSFEVTHIAANLDAAEDLLDEGEVSAVFVIPQGFEQALNDQGETAALAATIDGSNTAIASYTAAYAEGVVAHYAAQIIGEQVTLPVSAEPRIWYNQELRRENFYIPGLLGTMLSLVVLAITAVSIVGERERGTLEQLMVTPIRSLELIVGKLLPTVVIAYGELVIMLLIATRVFDIDIRGSLALYAGLMFVYLLAEMGTGVLVSILAGSQAQALPTVFLWVTTCGILAGFITPVDTMPPGAQLASVFVPLKYFTVISRELFAKGAGLQELLPQLIPLAIMSLVLFATSALLLRRRST